MNKNGIISFQLPFTEYKPQRFPLNNLIPLIAPFWDDVDVGRGGNIFFKETSNANLLQRARDQLQELFPSSGNFTPTTLFIATWDRVPTFVCKFQVSAYMTIIFLFTITTQCISTAWRSRETDVIECYGGLLIIDVFMSIKN